VSAKMPEGSVAAQAAMSGRTRARMAAICAWPSSPWTGPKTSAGRGAGTSPIRPAARLLQTSAPGKTSATSPASPRTCLRLCTQRPHQRNPRLSHWCTILCVGGRVAADAPEAPPGYRTVTAPAPLRRHWPRSVAGAWQKRVTDTCRQLRRDAAVNQLPGQWPEASPLPSGPPLTEPGLQLRLVTDATAKALSP
jgi:hypothetical protein